MITNPDSENVWNEPSNVEEGGHLPNDKDFDELVQTDLEKLYIVAAEVEGRVERYSGRGMFGERCYSIYCDNATECIIAAKKQGILNASVDTMGKGAVVYWKSIKA